jgi:hypothetical protein
MEIPCSRAASLLKTSIDWNFCSSRAQYRLESISIVSNLLGKSMYAWRRSQNPVNPVNRTKYRQKLEQQSLNHFIQTNLNVNGFTRLHVYDLSTTRDRNQKKGVIMGNYGLPIRMLSVRSLYLIREITVFKSPKNASVCRN